MPKRTSETTDGAPDVLVMVAATISWLGRTCQAGETVELPADVAQDMIAKGLVSAI